MFFRSSAANPQYTLKKLSNSAPIDCSKRAYSLEKVPAFCQSIGAELDNFFKVYCGFAAEDRKNMNDYCTFVLNDYSDIVNQKVLIPERDMEFQTYQGWNTANPAQSLTFWNGFCKIKHSRYANIQMANQKNVLYALSALYLLEMKYLSKIATSNEPDVPNKKSELFELDNWTYHFTPMGEMFACIDGEVCQIIGDEN